MLRDERFCSELTADVLNAVGISSTPIKQRKLDLHRAIVKLCGGETGKLYDPVHLVAGRFVDSLENTNQVHRASYCNAITKD